MKQTTIRAQELVIPNENISFPIGTALAVTKYSAKLGFDALFSGYKKKGVNLSRLVEALVTYRLTENQSISRGSDWINRPEVLHQFSLGAFEERTLFRALEVIGENYEEVIYSLQGKVFSLYDFPHTDTNLDWTSFVLWGSKATIGEYGYSRDHRPDKKQVTVGLAQLQAPMNLPIGLTIQAGNVNDQTHFKKTFLQVCGKLKKGSMLVFDKGGQSKNNLDLVLAGKMKYLSGKKLNLSDDKLIKKFVKSKNNCIDATDGVYGEIIEYPSR